MDWLSSQIIAWWQKGWCCSLGIQHTDIKFYRSGCFALVRSIESQEGGGQYIISAEEGVDGRMVRQGSTGEGQHCNQGVVLLEDRVSMLRCQFDDVEPVTLELDELRLTPRDKVPVQEHGHINPGGVIQLWVERTEFLGARCVMSTKIWPEGQQQTVLSSHAHSVQGWHVTAGLGC